MWFKLNTGKYLYNNFNEHAVEIAMRNILE